MGQHWHEITWKSFKFQYFKKEGTDTKILLIKQVIQQYFTFKNNILGVTAKLGKKYKWKEKCQFYSSCKKKKRPGRQQKTTIWLQHTLPLSEAKVAYVQIKFIKILLFYRNKCNFVWINTVKPLVWSHPLQCNVPLADFNKLCSNCKFGQNISGSKYSVI